MLNMRTKNFIFGLENLNSVCLLRNDSRIASDCKFADVHMLIGS